MAKHHPSFVPLILLLLLIATVSAATCPTVNTTTSFPLSTSFQPQDDQQLNNIIEAMIGSGDFNSWVNMISSGDFPPGSSFSIWATFFIPSNELHFPLDPFIVAYHVVPQRLSFSDLLLLKPLSRLPTLLPSKSILVTNTSASNFTLDNSLVFYPDLYLSSSIAVHGIQNILDYSVYGDSSLSPPSLPPPPPVSMDLSVEEGEVAGGGRISSDAAACLCWEFPTIFLVVFGILALKIYGNLFGVW